MKKSIIFIIIGMIAVIGVYVSRYLDTPVETRIARYTEHEESFEGDSYLVREESVYAAGASGTFYSYAEEGTRVGKNRLLATVYDGVVNPHTLQELDNIQKKLEEFEDMNKNDIFIVDSSNAENRLKNLKNQIIEAAQKNNPAEIVKAKNSIKSIVSGEATEDNQKEKENLLKRKADIEAELGNSKEDIYSSNSGVYSTNIDELEGYFFPDKISEYTVADFDAAAELIKNSTGKITTLSGENVCKVIDNHVWYVLVKAESEKIFEYKKGQKVMVRFDSIPGVETEAEIVSVSSEEEKSIIALKCEKYVEGIFSIRRSNVEVISKQYRGFEIPIYAVRVKDGVQGVMVQYGVNEVFKPCEVIYTDKDEGTVIIKPVTEGITNPLEQYDRIVIGEKAEEEGRNLG